MMSSTYFASLHTCEQLMAYGILSPVHNRQQMLAAKFIQFHPAQFGCSVGYAVVTLCSLIGHGNKLDKFNNDI